MATRANSTSASPQPTRSSRPSSRCCNKPLSTSPATPTSMPRGSGHGPKPSTWSSAPSAPPSSSCTSIRDYTYTQSAAAYNEWMAQKYPEMNDEIKRRIKEGRWEIVGGMWVEPDLNMPDGESLVRQLLVGKRWYKKRLRGRRPHRLEPGQLRLHMAVAADLQEVRS